MLSWILLFQILGTPGQWQGAGAPTVPCVPGQVYYQTNATPPASDMWRCNTSNVWFQPTSSLVNTGGSYADPAWLTSLASTKLTATGTPSASTYLRGDYSWATIAGGGTWGTITGTLSSQTDLQSALDGKLATGANAASATVLATPRAINGQNFDGSAPITVTANLPADPAACTAGQYTTDQSAAGTLTCAQVAYSQVSGTPILAAVATSGSATDLTAGALPAARMPALTGDVTTTVGTVATTVGKINGVSMSGLATGILKNTTTTGVPSIATAGTDYVIPSGSVATLTTPRNINGTAFNGSADITVTAAAGTLTGATLASGVTASSLTSLGASPTISGFTNANHTHADAAGGGTLNASAIAAGTVATARLGSGTANSTTYLRGDGTWTSPAGSGDVVGPASAVNNNIVLFDTTTGKLIKDSGRVLPTRVYLSGNVTNNNAVANTIADVTALSFAVTSGVRYKFKFYITYTSAATTTGSRWAINGPTTTELNYFSYYTLTATSQTTNFAVAYDIPAASNATSLTAGNVAQIEGIIKPSANGTVIARFASEVSSSAVIALAGLSYVDYEVIP